MIQYVHKGNYETTKFDGEWIILNTDNFTITKLNVTGGFCWSMLSEAKTVDSLCNAVEIEFGSICNNVKEDVEAFLMDLVDCGLIQHAL